MPGLGEATRRPGDGAHPTGEAARADGEAAKRRRGERRGAWRDTTAGEASGERKEPIGVRLGVARLGVHNRTAGEAALTGVRFGDRFVVRVAGAGVHGRLRTRDGVPATGGACPDLQGRDGAGLGAVLLTSVQDFVPGRAFVSARPADLLSGERLPSGEHFGPACWLIFCRSFDVWSRKYSEMSCDGDFIIALPRRDRWTGEHWARSDGDPCGPLQTSRSGVDGDFTNREARVGFGLTLPASTACTLLGAPLSRARFNASFNPPPAWTS